MRGTLPNLNVEHNMTTEGEIFFDRERKRRKRGYQLRTLAGSDGDARARVDEVRPDTVRLQADRSRASCHGGKS